MRKAMGDSVFQCGDLIEIGPCLSRWKLFVNWTRRLMHRPVKYQDPSAPTGETVTFVGVSRG